MANVTTAADMVAADQLYKSVLQTLNAAITDKNEEISNLICIQTSYGHQKIDCGACLHKDKCGTKATMEELTAKIDELTDEKKQLVDKYAKLQDDIKTFLLS